uniref:Capsid protein n=1 Tax=Coleura bat parvovirus TaxID=3141917 RepID=A0AAU7E1J7_9VIRU
MPTKTFNRTFFAYIKNDGNQMTYPTDATKKRQTGWHLIPNQILNNYLLPIDLSWIYQNVNTFKPISTTTTISHGIPITDSASLGGKGQMLTFNNTIYTLIWEDKYDTLGLELHKIQGNECYDDYSNMTEGVTYKENATVDKLNFLKQFSQNVHSADTLNIDPLMIPSNVAVMYPGNNGYTYKWSLHEKDKCNFITVQPDISTICHNNNKTLNINWSPITWRDAPTGTDWYKKFGDRPFYHPVRHLLTKLMPVYSNKGNLLPHYQLINITNELTIEYHPTSHPIPSWNIPYAIVNVQGDGVIQYPSSKPNVPYGSDELTQDTQWKYNSQTLTNCNIFCGKSTDMQTLRYIKKITKHQTRTASGFSNDKSITIEEKSVPINNDTIVLQEQEDKTVL